MVAGRLAECFGKLGHSGYFVLETEGSLCGIANVYTATVELMEKSSNGVSIRRGAVMFLFPHEMASKWPCDLLRAQ